MWLCLFCAESPAPSLPRVSHTDSPPVSGFMAHPSPPTGAEMASRVRAKTVRRQLEDFFKTDLTDRKKEIGSIINDIINCNDKNGASVPEVKQEIQRKVKAEVVKRDSSPEPANSGIASDSDEAEEDDEELARRLQAEEETGGKRATRQSGRSSGQKRKSQSKQKKKTKSKSHASDSSDNHDSDSGSDTKSKKKVKKTGTKGGYLKPIPLSSELSAFVGAEEMPRHEVVKRIWSYCKENNLQDPKNKQFAICDDELRKVFGVKRVRLFGMMKLLGKHFLAHNNR